MYERNFFRHRKSLGHRSQSALKAGALGFTISGAGPTLIAFLEEKSQAKGVANAIAKAFSDEGQGIMIRLCQVDPTGATVIE